MRQLGLVVLAVALFVYSPVLAKDNKKDKPAPATQAQSVAAPSVEDAARQELIANITAMRNAEIRVAVLQQLLAEESAKLMNIQAVFCDRYKLDVDKWRRGLYIYDDKQQKFVEQQPKK
jgi:hypothetical protein